MNVYVDTSVVMRRMFGEPNALRRADMGAFGEAFASRLLTVELYRSIDRARLNGAIDDEDVAQLHERAQLLLAPVSLLAVSEAILQRASSPMPTVVGTLDAIHLSTALLLQGSEHRVSGFLTHDTQLARAARASGFSVVGA